MMRSSIFDAPDNITSGRRYDESIGMEGMCFDEDDLRLTSSTSQAHKDMNNYQPVQVFNLQKHPLSIQTVANQLSQDIIIVRFRKHIAVYYLKIKVPENRGGAPDLTGNTEDLFELVTIQELVLDGNNYVEAVALSSNVSLSFAEKSLIYAFSLMGRNSIYFVENKGEDILPRVDLSPNNNKICLVVENDSPVTHLKYDADQSRLIAALVEEPACNVWDTKTGMKVAEFQLQERGVAVCWHKTEPAKLMVAERGGKVVFFNVVKQLSIQSITVCSGPILCADWASGNSHLVGCASHATAYVVDVSKPYSTEIKVFETHPHFTLKMKFSNTDYKVFATVGKSDNKIKVFQLNFRSILWSQKRQDLQDIEWLSGRPYLLSIAGSKIAIHESSILS